MPRLPSALGLSGACSEGAWSMLVLDARPPVRSGSDSPNPLSPPPLILLHSWQLKKTCSTLKSPSYPSATGDSVARREGWVCAR
eukprot:scaffold12849_cov146-Isochrysis_galbana.AAC.1